MGKSGTTFSIKKGRGDDTLFVTDTYKLTNTSFDGGAGVDTLDLSSASYAVRIMLPESTSDPSRLWVNSTDENPQTSGHPVWLRYENFSTGEIRGTLKNIENIKSGSGHDILEGADGINNRIDGGGGNDHVSGGHSDSDVLIGGAGSDVLIAEGTDTLYGGTVSQPDDLTKDYFLISGTADATIIGFRPGVDELIFQAQVTTFAPAMITPTPEGLRFTYQHESGIASVLLKGVFGGVEAGYKLFGTLGSDGIVYSGGSTSDYFSLSLDTAGTPRLDIVQLGKGSGHDWAFYFDVGHDRLQLSGNEGEILWTESMVDGKTVLTGTYDMGQSSISLQGLTMADIPFLFG